MLPYFVATGHNLYAKSAHVYLQKMLHLQVTHPDVYADFADGHHVIRRSNRFWAGLSCDLVIEQTLMRSLKSIGGLTRGRGIGEEQRLVWALFMPTCASVNNWMQTFTGSLDVNDSEKHTKKSQKRAFLKTTETHLQLATSCTIGARSNQMTNLGLLYLARKQRKR